MAEQSEPVASDTSMARLHSWAVRRGGAPWLGVYLAAIVGLHAQTVPNNLTVSAETPPPYAANQTISTSTSNPFTVNNLASAVFQAGTTITLNPGFHAAQGSTFTALVAAVPSAASITLSPAPPSKVTSGANAAITINLTGPAPLGGATVALGSSNTGAFPNSTCLIAAGLTQATCSVQAGWVGNDTNVTVTATYNSGTPTAGAIVTPPPPPTLTQFTNSSTGSDNMIWGSSNVPVTITGTHFMQPASLSFYYNNNPTGNITVTNMVVQSATQITALLTVGPNASAGWFQVAVQIGTTTSGQGGFFIEPSVPTPLSINPSNAAGGYGSSQVFSFAFSESPNSTYLSGIVVAFGGTAPYGGNASAHGCYLSISPSTALVDLADDNGGWTISGYLYANQTLSNAQCVVTLSNSAYTGAGTTATLNLNMSFTQNYAGSHNILAYVDNGYSNSSANLGSYTVLGTAGPSVGASPTSMLFQAMQGTNPPAQTITISNAGGGTLSWSASIQTGTFLNLSGTTSGQLAGNTTATVGVVVNSASLAPGPQSGVIQITATGASNSPLLIPVSLTVTGAGTVAAPTMSPGPGIYGTARTVTLTASPANALIRYTTDGSTPTEIVGTQYTGPINLAVTTTLSAIAYLTGWTHSSIASGLYTISPQTASPIFTPTGGSVPQTVTITTTTQGATIRYTTDLSTPTESNGTVYTTAISVSTPSTLKAIAYASGFSDSAVATAGYTSGGPAGAPTASPASGSMFTAPTAIQLTSSTPGASIRYTTDGSTPTQTAGILYGGPFTLSGPATVRAVAYATGWQDSPVTSATFTFAAAPPTCLPAAGTYAPSQTVALFTATPGARIRFTTDNSTPSESVGTLYSSPIAVSNGMTILAIAYVQGVGGWTDSAITSATYIIQNGSGGSTREYIRLNGKVIVIENGAR